MYSGTRRACNVILFAAAGRDLACGGCFFIQRGRKIHPIGSSYLFSSFIHFRTCAEKGKKKKKKRLLLPPASRACVETRTLFSPSENVFLKSKYALYKLKILGRRDAREEVKILKGGSLVRQHIFRNGFFTACTTMNYKGLQWHPFKKKTSQPIKNRYAKRGDLKG